MSKGRPKLNTPKKSKLTLTPSKYTCDIFDQVSKWENISKTQWLEEHVLKEYKKLCKKHGITPTVKDQLTIEDIIKTEDEHVIKKED